MPHIPLIIFIFLFSYTPLYAASFSVNSVAQLEVALATAENNSEDDIINIAAGTYFLTSSLNYDTQKFGEKNAIVLQGIEDGVILDGSTMSNRILLIRNSDADITIRNITFQNGYSPEGNSGAGLLLNSSGGNIVLENCKVINCFAAAFYFTNNGGGAFITAGFDSNVSIRNCIFAGNTAKGLGGGLYLNLANGVLTFVNNTVINNLNKSSVVESGGGIYLRLFWDSAVAHLHNNILWGNEYLHGKGDLYIDDAEADPEKGATVFLYNNDYEQLNWNLGDNITLSDNISQPPLLSESYHLSSDSPCLDSGNPNAPWLAVEDFEQDLRSLDGNCDGQSLPDIGADEYYQLAALTTTAATNIKSTTAISGGNVNNEGGHPITKRGVCWSKSTEPTLTDFCTDNGSGDGTFVSSITGLTANTLYYIRAYATNCQGTSYGTQTSFSTKPAFPWSVLILLLGDDK